MLNKKGFLLIESLLVFEQAIVLILVFSQLAFALYVHQQKTQDNHPTKDQQLKQYYEQYKLIEQEEIDEEQTGIHID